MQTDITVYADDCTGDSLLIACEGTSVESGGSTWQRALDALAFPSPRGPYPVSNRFTVFIHETLPNSRADTNVLATYRIDVVCEQNVAHVHVQGTSSRVASKDVRVCIGDDVVEIARAIFRSAA
ncbi:hypothetical protein [Paraburkholderia graminis]|jgi:hypothetical protein|uniref:hypothetical protein n=1 Tax=Paraburkholderia graminis TaxID=60548 RepID=UPI001290386A|nr:hypothetical protein [Paraburkholderia graminis]